MEHSSARQTAHMRSTSLSLMVTAAACIQACSFTSDGGVTGRFESTNEAHVASAVGSWDETPLFVSSSQGSIQVVGVAGKKNIEVRARFVAGANSQADADAAFADIAKNITVAKRDGRWVVDCAHASAWHGSVDPESTGCTSMRVEVPAGTRAVPLSVTARAPFGGVHVSGVTVDELHVTAPFGIVADVLPVAAATIRLHGANLVSGLCSTTLRVPADTTIESAALTVDKPSVEYAGVAKDDPTYWLGAYVEGFANAPQAAPRSASVAWRTGGAPFAAKTIELHASLGKAVLTTAPVPAYRPTNQCLHMDLKLVAAANTTVR
jgi:hypothetical protein